MKREFGLSSAPALRLCYSTTYLYPSADTLSWWKLIYNIYHLSMNKKIINQINVHYLHTVTWIKDWNTFVQTDFSTNAIYRFFLSLSLSLFICFKSITILLTWSHLGSELHRLMDISLCAAMLLCACWCCSVVNTWPWIKLQYDISSLPNLTVFSTSVTISSYWNCYFYSCLWLWQIHCWTSQTLCPSR